MSILGKPITSGTGVVPAIFGTGDDGDLVILSGETVTLSVAVPHQSIVEKNYNSILIEAGGTLNCSDPNAGLVLRCKGACTIHGTIDQNAKAPKTNPNNTYQYPAELVCGAGGAGGGGYNSSGSAGMAGRPYGGGYGGGGGGGKGAVGGSAIDITIDVPDSSLFRGGAGETKDISSKEQPGQNGGGGGGGGQGRKNGTFARGGNGGTGAGSNGGNGGYNSSERYSGGGGGGAGNIGGGIVMLYAGGDLSMDGCTINCNGGNGGAGGENSYVRASGGGGGGGGGGAIYFVHFNPMSESDLLAMSLNVNGGSGGGSNYATTGAAGGLGSITIKQYEKGMTA